MNIIITIIIVALFPKLSGDAQSIIFIPAFSLALCHIISAFSKAESIEDEDYNYFITQVYIMFEFIVVSLVIISFVLAILSCICRICSSSYKSYRDQNGNNVYLTNWGGHLEDSYGNRYTKDSRCEVF